MPRTNKTIEQIMMEEQKNRLQMLKDTLSHGGTVEEYLLRCLDQNPEIKMILDQERKMVIEMLYASLMSAVMQPRSSPKLATAKKVKAKVKKVGSKRKRGGLQWPKGYAQNAILQAVESLQKQGYDTYTARELREASGLDDDKAAFNAISRLKNLRRLPGIIKESERKAARQAAQ
jgi:hypothetical protein